MQIDLNFERKGRLLEEELDEVFKRRRSSMMSLPSIDRKILSTVQKINGCWIAGGAALALYSGDLQIKDWDLFFNSEENLLYMKRIIKSYGFEYKNKSDWSLTYSLSNVVVQLIKRNFYSNVSEIFRYFDFTVCCFAIDGNRIFYTAEARRDLDSKELNFIYTDNIYSSIKRIARYGKKGFIPSNQFVIDISKEFLNLPKLKSGSGES